MQDSNSSNAQNTQQQIKNIANEGKNLGKAGIKALAGDFAGALKDFAKTKTFKVVLGWALGLILMIVFLIFIGLPMFFYNNVQAFFNPDTYQADYCKEITWLNNTLLNKYGVELTNKSENVDNKPTINETDILDNLEKQIKNSKSSSSWLNDVKGTIAGFIDKIFGNNGPSSSSSLSFEELKNKIDELNNDIKELEKQQMINKADSSEIQKLIDEKKEQLNNLFQCGDANSDNLIKKWLFYKEKKSLTADDLFDVKENLNANIEFSENELEFRKKFATIFEGNYNDSDSYYDVKDGRAMPKKTICKTEQDNSDKELSDCDIQITLWNTPYTNSSDYTLNFKKSIIKDENGNITTDTSDAQKFLSAGTPFRITQTGKEKLPFDVANVFGLYSAHLTGSYDENTQKNNLEKIKESEQKFQEKFHELNEKNVENLDEYKFERNSNPASLDNPYSSSEEGLLITQFRKMLLKNIDSAFVVKPPSIKKYTIEIEKEDSEGKTYTITIKVGIYTANIDYVLDQKIVDILFPVYPNMTENQTNTRNMLIKSGFDVADNLRWLTINDYMLGVKKENKSYSQMMNSVYKDTENVDVTNVKSNNNFGFHKLIDTNGVNGFGISSGFGSRPSMGDFHTGIDLSGGGVGGKSIFAAQDGIVVKTGYQKNGYGNFVMIKHKINNKDVFTLYAHCSRLNVDEGENVSKGQGIGSVGSTGRSTGNHLHFEVLFPNEKGSLSPVNPRPYINSSLS